MKVLDLFSGIGGFSLGLEWAGMSTVAMCEKDPYCRKILAKHWPDLTIHEDIRNLDGRQYTKSIDLVCGGFPCQPFSVAGKRKGTDDDRHLWPEMLRVIQESRPRWVIGENVFGFVNMALDDVQADLEREHYEVRKFLLPAVAVDARHRRDRIILIAYSNSPAIWDIPERQAQGRNNLQAGRQAITTHDGSPQSLADSSRQRMERDWTSGVEESQPSGSQGLSGCNSSGGEPRVWQAEPCVGRISDGVPNRVDRIKGLGNAVVPQLIQAIGELVIKADREMRNGR